MGYAIQSEHVMRTRKISGLALRSLYGAGYLVWGVLAFANAASAGDSACYQSCLDKVRAQSGATILAPLMDTAFCRHSCGYAPTVDYQCVKVCAAQPTPRGSCVQSCSFYPNDSDIKAKSAIASVHNQFIAPETSQGVEITAPRSSVSPSTPPGQLFPTVRPLSPSIDYKARNACLQQGFSYSYCAVASQY
jgi:hypothetical protein